MLLPRLIPADAEEGSASCPCCPCASRPVVDASLGPSALARARPRRRGPAPSPVDAPHPIAAREGEAREREAGPGARALDDRER